MHRIDDIACVARVALLCSALALSACASNTEVFTTDLTRQQGLYVVGYTTDAAIRLAMEDQLVADLTARGIAAFPSHADIPDLANSSAEQVVRAADSQGALGVVLINQAVSDGGDSPVQNPQRVTPLHPDIRSFYAQSRHEMRDEPASGDPIFAEVNLFLVDGAATRLFWSGTTWTFNADGRGGAIQGISETVAAQMQQARDEFERSNVFRD
jgi:hypothetical protein